MPAKRILIIYHSGSGGTKCLSEVFRAKLSGKFDCETITAHDDLRSSDAQRFDLLLFGFPVFHLEPSRSIREFVERMVAFPVKQRAFVFVTKSVVSQNTIRLFARMLRPKNVVVCGSTEFRAPATDLSLKLSRARCEALLAKNSSFVFGFEPDAEQKVDCAVADIEALLARDAIVSKLPALKWYSPLLWPVQKLYFDCSRRNRFGIRILPERCNDCRFCQRFCKRGAWSGEEQLRHDPELCDGCVGCVHLCPQRAIIYNESMKDNPRLDNRFYRRIAKEYFSVFRQR